VDCDTKGQGGERAGTAKGGGNDVSRGSGDTGTGDTGCGDGGNGDSGDSGSGVGSE
jgi:hypothetical protein